MFLPVVSRDKIANEYSSAVVEEFDFPRPPLGDWAIFTTTLLYQLPTADFFLKMKEQASIKLIVPVPLVFVEI